MTVMTGGLLFHAFVMDFILQLWDLFFTVVELEESFAFFGFVYPHTSQRIGKRSMMEGVV